MSALHRCGALADLMGVMRGTSSRGPDHTGSRMASEAGFALIEVLVSAVLVIVLATATLGIIERAGRQAGNDRSRSLATAIAQADQDRLRAMPVAQLYNY